MLKNGSSRVHRMMALVALMFGPLMFHAGQAIGQSLATVSGDVADQSGAALPDVRVDLKNSATNLEHMTTTNSSGHYVITNVTPGTYSFQVSKDGFHAVSEGNAVISLGQVATFNFSLTVGSVNQSVTVSAEASEIESSTAALGAVISSASVNSLPLNGRNFTELLQLTPGASPISVSQNVSAGGTASNPVGQFTFPAVDGQRNRSNMFLLDGANNFGGYTSTYNYQPVVDAVQEFKVQSHSDLAEYGQVVGGTISVITKGGTNQFHGSAWGFLRNSFFDARNYFLPKVNPLRQNQFGVAVGGPVTIPHVYRGANKTFFFFTYEGFRQSQANQNLEKTPTTAQLGGDFSNLLANGIVIYDPFSTAPDPANPGSFLRTPYSNNKIPTNELSAGALLYAKYAYPAPNASGLPGGNNLIDVAPQWLRSNSFSGRIDEAIGQHDQLFGRISQYNQPSATPSDADLLNAATLNGYNLAISETHNFGATASLEGHYTRNLGVNDILLVFNNAPSDFASQLLSNGFSSAFMGGFTGGPSSTTVPVITVSGYIGSSNVNNFQNLQFANTNEYGGSFAKTWGRHNFKVGGVIASNNFTMPIASVSETTSAFNTSNLEQPTSSTGASTGDALASFLLGVPSSVSRRGVNEKEHGGWADGVYLQDQYQVTSKLSFNVGVRWDVAIWPIQSYLSDGQGYVGTMDLTNGTYILAAMPPACSSTVSAPCIPGGSLPANVVVTPHSNHALHNTDYNDWQGRFGFAWHLSHSNTLLGGYGRYYDIWNSTTQYMQNLAGTWPSVGLLSAANLNPNLPTVTIGNPLNQQSGSVVQPAATPFGNATFYINPNFKTTYSDQWNLGAEHAFGTATVLGLHYVGAHDGNIDFGALQNTAEFPAAGTSAQVASRRLYPYIVPTKWDNSSEHASYNALQTTLHRSTQNGLTYLISYTWAKSIDEGCSDSFGSGCVVQDPYHPRTDRSVSSFDLKHMFSASAVYQIPFGSGRMYSLHNRAADTILGGWDVNAILFFRSGQPYSVTSSGDNANTGNTLVQANLVGNPTPTNRSAAQWINPAAFQTPPRYSFGNFGRNALRSDWGRDLDMSVFKTFPLTEQMKLEFRAEAFNLTNTAEFAIPQNVVNSSGFGAVTSTANVPRQLQFALKIQF